MEQPSRRRSRRTEQAPALSPAPTESPTDLNKKVPDYYQDPGKTVWLKNCGIGKKALPDGGEMIIYDGLDR